ncbi:MAG: sterol desaturase family protein, partial [Deltaproteobacteria bacterium]|nr:sterol desaturase family protein [Deltaproteobacteria bacterium]
MGLAGEIALALALGPPLWLCGAIGFDAVHWALHRMLRSRHAWLRALAWPHSVHHDWIDEKLEIHWDQQGRNVWCHIVPEYATQLAFTGALAALLPPAFPLVVGALQTAVFVGILRARGLDRNHRPVRLLDAYAPGPHTPPAYHALHHAYPDAYFSAYTKLVDALVGGGAALAGRRFALLGEDAFADALAAELSSWGVASTERWTAL